MNSRFVIGSRSSQLALWQANHVKSELLKLFPDLEISIKEIKTKGDHVLDVPLSKVGGKGLFTKEIEDALLNKEIDLAVHSLKDLPTKLPNGLKISVVLKRENPSDVLISKDNVKFKDLKKGSKIGTSSLRRMSQLKNMRGDLEYLDLRGNLDTRIKKLDEGIYDAIVLAYAGVKRLGLENRITEIFNPKDLLPAVGQGALAIEIRENDIEAEKLIMHLNHPETFLISICERSFLEEMQGGCQVPIGIYSAFIDGVVNITGLVASLDGSKVIRGEVEGKLEINECKKLGILLAKKLLQNGGREIMDKINNYQAK